MAIINCPECDSPVNVDQSTIYGEIIPCGDCGVDLEVTDTAPYQLAMAPEEDEDWGE